MFRSTYYNFYGFENLVQSLQGNVIRNGLHLNDIQYFHSIFVSKMECDNCRK